VDFIKTLPKAYEGALEGGTTGTAEDVAENNVIPEREQTNVNIPTHGKPSPMFDAIPFTQKMLRFEEFGPEPLDPTAPAAAGSFPRPSVGTVPEQDPYDVFMSEPSGFALDAFMAQKGISPFPTEYSNTVEENPWRLEIEDFLGRELDTPPAEGRPPGKGWAHQRWEEFYPQAYFKTVQAGARVNSGLRDKKQMHGYRLGEFGPGGLYHNVTGSPATDGTSRGTSTFGSTRTCPFRTTKPYGPSTGPFRLSS
jgi:hypothetical protein